MEIRELGDGRESGPDDAHRNARYGGHPGDRHGREKREGREDLHDVEAEDGDHFGEREDDAAIFSVDGDGDGDGDLALDLDEGEGAAGVEQPELHRLLRGIADEVVPPARGDLYPQVIKRAAAIRRRRRAVRATSVTAVLAVAVVVGPSAAHRLGVRGGTAVAAPPSAVVDLASAYPAAEPAFEARKADVAVRPANALDWPVRGEALPDDATSLAMSYVVGRGGGGGGGDEASVSTLWAGVEDDTTGVVGAVEGKGGKQELVGVLGGVGVGSGGGGGVNVNGSPERLVAQDAHKTWLFVMQGWTVGADGAPTSQAELLVGEYKQSADAARTVTTSMTVRAMPITFAHPRPGSGDDKDDTEQIAELSVWLPDSGRLLVLGAPQAKTVLYAKTGGDLIPQKTVDGVALFPRTKSLVKGRYADAIQVRDAKNVALTPPKAWSAGDFVLTGPVDEWVSSAPGWVSVAGGQVGGEVG
ncbi:MAG: hypothetical protein HOW97_24575, partial [Catenulispora sp.]|nr:hypothetical protein [Catenulispora sp.]